MPQKFANNAQSVLVSGITAVATTLTVETLKADLFPEATTTTWVTPLDFYKLVLSDGVNREVVRVGIRAFNSPVMSNILRAQDGTTARVFPNGATVICGFVARDVDDINVTLGAQGAQIVANAATAAATTTTGDALIRSDLAASSGPGAIGFDGSLNYAVGTLGAHFFGEVNIKDFPWSCKCDSNGTAGNGTNDTAGFWAAVAFAKAKGYKIIHPGGICRITSGYTQSVAFHNIFLHGNGRINQPDSASVGSTILLDSVSPASYFLNIAANTTLNCTGIIFQCAQGVIDRPFIKFSASLHAEFFANCHFLNVERPIVFAAGSYFQNSSYRDIMFYNSGTFHSESPDTPGALIGTLLTLDNVNHDGPVGAAGIISEKIVCNLQGIRKIWASNFLLEGSLPAAGWTILKINETFENRFTRDPFIEVFNFWSEWTGFAPLYTVDQIGGTAMFTGHLGLSLTNKYKLSKLGRVNLVRISLIYTTDEASLFFEPEDGQCIVHFDSCMLRNFDLTKVGFLHTNTQYADATNGFGQLVLSNTVAEPIYRWTGGNIPADGCTLSLFSGTAVTSTDASFGRKIVFSPAAGLLNAQIRIPTVVGNLVKGEQIVVRAKAKLPTFATGLWRFDILIDNVTLLIKYFAATNSGQIVDVVIPWVLTANATINVGVGFSNGTTSGVATDVEVYALSVYHGHGIARSLVALYPTNVNTHGTAAPTTGTWSRGDRVSNSAPAVAAVKAWACTATGTPGTWVSEGNL